MDDLEKELLNYNEMGTSIEKIKKPDINFKKFNINNFVKELENNLDNFDNTNININYDSNYCFIILNIKYC